MSKRWFSTAGVMSFFIAVFCVSFLYFYTRIQKERVQTGAPQASNAPINKADSDRQQLANDDTRTASKSLIDKPFPHAPLTDTYGTKVDEQVLRRGKVIIVFVTRDCDACIAESKFLQTVLDRRPDVNFYGVVPFAQRESPDANEKVFPFTIFYDQSNSYVASMGINRVPVKVFLQDGIIKKGWIGAAISDTAKTSFVEWLDRLP